MLREVSRSYRLAIVALIAVTAAAPARGEQPDAAPGRQAADADATAAPAPAIRGGSIAGTVLWAGKASRAGSCEVHDFDVEGLPKVTGGLDDVVVIAQPLSPATQRLFRARKHSLDEDNFETFYWGDGDSGGSTRVATVAPDVPLEFHNVTRQAATVRVLRGLTLVIELALPPKASVKAPLPEGLLRVVGPDGKFAGWIYVTPYPAWVSGGNCRFSFSHLPGGRYRLRGWHPREGTRSRIVDVRARAKVVKLTPLIYGDTPPPVP
jgi:hypothetical protein